MLFCRRVSIPEKRFAINRFVAKDCKNITKTAIFKKKKQVKNSCDTLYKHLKNQEIILFILL
jgi:hypothetical protein